MSLFTKSIKKHKPNSIILSLYFGHSLPYFKLEAEGSNGNEVESGDTDTNIEKSWDFRN